MPEALPDYVSFVIPAHNEQEYLPTTLTALQQATAPLGDNLVFEIIVVDDDSTDQTGFIAESFGAKVVKVSLRNIGAVRNAGAAQANHRWLIFLDADTLLPHETLRGTLDALRMGCSGGGARVRVSDELPIPLVKRLMCLSVVFVWQILGRWAAGCYMFCPKEKFDQFGGFDERFFAAEELFFSRNLKKMGRFVLIRHPVITSARKLHRYSVFQLLSFMLAPAKRFWAPLKSQEGLDILYKDQR